MEINARGKNTRQRWLEMGEVGGVGMELFGEFLGHVDAGVVAEQAERERERGQQRREIERKNLTNGPTMDRWQIMSGLVHG